MSFPSDLLEQARHLANRERKHPKQASRPTERFTVARMLDHGTMAKVCTAKRDKLNELFKTRPAPGRHLDILNHLHLITNTFVEMQDHRHHADYNGERTWSRTDVLQKIDSVEAAFRSWKEIRDEHEAQNFLVTLLLRERK